MVSYNIDPNEGVKNSEQNRLMRLREIGGELANEQSAREMEVQQEGNAAWKSAYNDAGQPAPATAVSQDQSGSPNVTTGQTQVQAVPVSPNPAPAAGPLASMQVPQVNASALAQPGTGPNPSPPPATAFQGVPAAPASAPPPPSPAQPAPQAPKASPFDSPRFQQALAEHLAGMPNGGLALQAIKKERDAVIGKVMEAIGNGHTDAARYMAQQNGLDIPENLYQNSNMAEGLSLSQKAYPDEPDKGQIFYQTFMSTQGDLPSRVQAGMAAAGVPTPTAQRELQKAIALAKFNESRPQTIVTTKGLVKINPAAGTATPYRYEGTNEPVTGVVGGTGIGRNTAMTGGGFGYKQQQWLAIHPGDEEGALRFAMGQTAMPLQSTGGAASAQQDGPVVGTTAPDDNGVMRMFTGGDYRDENNWQPTGGR